MTWIIYKGDRTEMFNSSVSNCIDVREVADDEWILDIWFGESRVQLDYPSEKECKQAMSYLIESIRRGDNMVSV